MRVLRKTISAWRDRLLKLDLPLRTKFPSFRQRTIDRMKSDENPTATGNVSSLDRGNLNEIYDCIMTSRAGLRSIAIEAGITSYRHLCGHTIMKMDSVHIYKVSSMERMQRDGVMWILNEVFQRNDSRLEYSCTKTHYDRGYIGTYSHESFFKWIFFFCMQNISVRNERTAWNEYSGGKSIEMGKSYACFEVRTFVWTGFNLNS